MSLSHTQKGLVSVSGGACCSPCCSPAATRSCGYWVTGISSPLAGVWDVYNARQQRRLSRAPSHTDKHHTQQACEAFFLTESHRPCASEHTRDVGSAASKASALSRPACPHAPSRCARECPPAEDVPHPPLKPSRNWRLHARGRGVEGGRGGVTVAGPHVGWSTTVNTSNL